MIYINIIVEGSSEETFVNDVITPHFAKMNKFISVRKIKTGWDKSNDKPVKGGLLKYMKFKNDVIRWIESDRSRPNTFYTSFIDLYAFPIDSESPYIESIRTIKNVYQKVDLLETAIYNNINCDNFIPYVQLHEFEAFLLVDPDRLLMMYPEHNTSIKKLKKETKNKHPEEINDSPFTAPSKRIIKYIPDYKGQKAQVAPLIAEDIGLFELRNKCPHFNNWITKLENL